MRNNYLPFIFTFALFVVILSFGCEDDDCSDLTGPTVAVEKTNISFDALLKEVELVENSGGSFVIFKEGGDFEQPRTAGIQVHGDFGTNGPNISLGGKPLLDNYNGKFFTLSDASRDFIKKSFSATSLENIPVSLSDKGSNESILNGVSVQFPEALEITTDISTSDLAARQFDMNTSLTWKPATKGTEIIVAIYGGPPVTIPGLVDKGASMYDYNIFSVADNGSYQFSPADFAGLKVGDVATILVVRYSKNMVTDQTGATSMILSLSLNGSNYVLTNKP